MNHENRTATQVMAEAMAGGFQWQLDFKQKDVELRKWCVGRATPLATSAEDLVKSAQKIYDWVKQQEVRSKLRPSIYDALKLASQFINEATPDEGMQEEVQRLREILKLAIQDIQPEQG